MARQTNAQYWAQRLKNMEEALLNQSYSYVENLEKQFAAAEIEIERQMSAWYQRLANNNDLTLADAKKLLKADELTEFHWTVEQYIAYGQENAFDSVWMKQLENASAKVHISRLEALQVQIRQQAELLAVQTEKAAQSAAEAIYEGCYYHTAYEFQKGLGVGWSVSALNESTISKVLSKPWTTDMQTFRDRCWTNKTSLVDSVNKHLTQMIIRGDSPDKAIAAIAKDFEVSKSKAGRLIMTESAYFSSAAQKDCYKELDVEQYQIVASLDHETCTLCGAMDGKVFKLSDYQPGLTANPFHPWCRCCTAPYFEDMDGLGERYARDAVTGERYKVSRNMSYEQWKEKQDELHGVGTVDLQRKISYNETTDKAQYEKYKERLGSDAPRSFAKFQDLKYHDTASYDELVGMYSYKGRVPEATKADYETYKAIKATGVVGTIRVPPIAIDASKIEFRDSHAARHGCTISDAQNYVSNAKCSISRKKWDGTSINYYSIDGAAYLDEKALKVKTCFSKKNFDSTTKKIVEVFK